MAEQLSTETIQVAAAAALPMAEWEADDEVFVEPDY